MFKSNLVTQNLKRTTVPKALFYKLFRIAGLNETFAEQLLQALQVIASIVFKDDHLLKAVAVAQQELQIVDVRPRETVTDKVNLFGVFQVVIGLGPKQVEKASAQERFLGMRHWNEDGSVFAVDGETAVLRFDFADVFQVEFVACALDGEPVERAMQFDKVYGAAGFAAFCGAVGRVNLSTETCSLSSLSLAIAVSISVS